MSAYEADYIDYPLTISVGRRSADLVDGVSSPKGSGGTRQISVEGRDHLLRLRDRLFSDLLVLTPLQAERPFKGISTDVWSAAREVETIVMMDGGPSLIQYIDIRRDFEEWAHANGLSHEWSFLVLLDMALYFVSDDFSDSALKSLARALNVVLAPDSAGWAPHRNEVRS